MKKIRKLLLFIKRGICTTNHKEIVLEMDYNINYILKDTGYFKNYIYKYSDFLYNFKLLNPAILKDKAGILYLNHKTKIVREIHLTGILYFNDKSYYEWLFLIRKIISSTLDTLNYNKELKNLLVVIKIWLFRDISILRSEIKAQEKFNKKMLRFKKVIDYLVEYKVITSVNYKLFSRFWTEKVLTKDLKPVLHIKVVDEEKQQECIQHLLNLMSLKWENINPKKFKDYIHRAIKVHQDNWEHNDAWDLVEVKKLVKNV